MKTRDEQAMDYINDNYGKSNKSKDKPFARIVAYRAFRNGWDAALKSQWRDARVVLPTDSIGKEYLIHVDYNDGSGFNHCSAAFINGHWNILDDEILEDVDSGKAEITHWMPIPDLP